MARTLAALVATVILTWPVRGLGIGILFYTYRPWLRQSKKSTSIELFVRFLRQLGRTWVTAELVFIIYYLLSKRWIQARTSSPQLKGDRVKMLKRCFRSIEMIHKGLLLEKAAVKNIVPKLVKNCGTATSIEALLRRWKREPGFRDEAEELQALKLAVASGWFLGADPRDVCEENHKSNLAWAFFDRDVDHLCETELNILQKLVKELCKWGDVTLKAGWNPIIQAVKLNHDPVPTKYRPLVFYALCFGVSDVFNYVLLRSLGFQYHRTGSLYYWRFPGKSLEPPIVFCHGIGIGLVPYISFIRGLLNSSPGRECFLVEMRNIMMCPQSMRAPSSAEIVVCIQEMLSAWAFGGKRAAHFIGHSFGTIVVGWMIKFSSELVAAATLIAPCPFLLCTYDLCVNFLYRKPTTFREVMFDYYVSKETNLAFYLRRNFIWHRNNLWADELREIPCLVILLGLDEIVPSCSVRYYLSAAKNECPEMPLEVVWLPEYTHAGLLYDTKQRNEILENIVRLGF